MSVISTFLAPYKVYIFIALAVIAAGGAFYYRHSLIVEGKDKEIAVLKASSDKLLAATAKQIAQNEADYLKAVDTILGIHNDQVKALSDQHDVDVVRLRQLDADRGKYAALASAAAARGNCSQYQEINGRLESSIANLEQVALGLRTAGDELNASLAEVSAERDQLAGK